MESALALGIEFLRNELTNECDKVLVSGSVMNILQHKNKKNGPLQPKSLSPGVS